MKRRSGFTLVELLIVVVVVAILASISIVAYNGIQTRAENAKTIQAVASWVKALQMYKIDTGNYPTVNTCLGASNTYTDSNGGVCWGDASNTTWRVQPNLSTMMADYIDGAPEPSSKNISTETAQRRGAMYYFSSAGGEEIRVNIIGASSVADCPSISGLGATYSAAVLSGGVSCYYRMPDHR